MDPKRRPAHVGGLILERYLGILPNFANKSSLSNERFRDSAIESVQLVCPSTSDKAWSVIGQWLGIKGKRVHLTLRLCCFIGSGRGMLFGSL